MAISNEILRLQSAKAALKTAIEGKGVTVPADALLDDYAALVDAIQTIPSAYTELEYIESSGTAYLYLPVNVQPSEYFGIDLKFMPKTTSSHLLFQASVSNQFYSSLYSYTASTGKILYSSTVGGINTGGGYNVDYNEINTIHLSTTHLMGTEKLRPIKSAFAYLQVLGTNVPIRIYELKIYHSDSIQFNLIPAKRNADNKIGMYDKVSGTFLTNAGTGTFGYGELA